MGSCRAYLEGCKAQALLSAPDSPSPPCCFLQRHFIGYTSMLSTLQQEAWDFADSLMAQSISHRPSAVQALRHPFLATASLESGEREMQLLLPNFSQDRDLLPIVPVNTSCLQHAVSLEVPSLSDTASVGSGWDIVALHGSPSMQQQNGASSGGFLTLDTSDS